MQTGLSHRTGFGCRLFRGYTCAPVPVRAFDLLPRGSWLSMCILLSQSRAPWPSCSLPVLSTGSVQIPPPSTPTRAGPSTVDVPACTVQFAPRASVVCTCPPRFHGWAKTVSVGCDVASQTRDAEVVAAQHWHVSVELTCPSGRQPPAGVLPRRPTHSPDEDEPEPAVEDDGGGCLTSLVWPRRLPLGRFSSSFRSSKM